MVASRRVSSQFVHLLMMFFTVEVFRHSQVVLARPKESAMITEELPLCEPMAVCGYVQLNPRGVSSQPICRCPDNGVCPLVWDALDGRTIVHGNDQYKYCQRAPVLSPCNSDEVVYSSYMEMSMVTMDTLVNNILIHCLCPPTHLFTKNHSDFHPYKDGLAAISVTSLCKKAPQCSIEDSCSAITDTFTSATSFVTRKCACPLGQFCPNDIRLASDRVDLDKGAYYMMPCI